MTRKLEDYRLGDKVEVKTAADPDNWYPGTVSAIRQHLEEGKTRTTLTVKWCSGSVSIFTSDGSASIRYPNDAIPVGTEVECTRDGKTWSRGVITSQVSDHVSYWVKHPDGHRHWPADKVRLPLPLPPPVRSADDLAKELVHMRGEWDRIVAVNGRLIEEAKAHAEEARRCHAEQVKAEIEVKRLAPLEEVVTSLRAQLDKVKEAHGDTTKAHFEASYNLGIARSERDDLAKELEREKENHLLLVKTFREVIDKLTKRTRELECELDARDGKIRELTSAVKDSAQVNIDAIDKLQVAIKRAETAEKALAERANIYRGNDAAIADIEAMWRRKFEGLERQLKAEQDCRLRIEGRLAEVKRVLG